MKVGVKGNVKVRKDMAHIANSLEESAMLWHERLGHLNMASLKELVNDELNF